MPVAPKPIIYQLVVRYFGNINATNRWAGEIEENGCGKFADIDQAAISSLSELGVTHIWFTGVMRQATLTPHPTLGFEPDDPDIVKGRAGSFYAVRDYFDVCPDYALDATHRMEEFEALVARIHAAQMQVLIDFVPNHVARSYRSLIRPELNFGGNDDQTRFFHCHNSFYYLVDPPGQRLELSRPSYWNPPGVQFDGRFEPEDGGPGRIPKATGDAWKFDTSSQPDETEWYEAIKLNYGYNYVEERGYYDPIPRTWQIMDEILAFWQAKGVDGFRCDMAQLVPREAWSYLIQHARQPERNPHVFFLAEAYIGSRSDDPVKSLNQLLEAGFDCIYHDNSYNRLTEIFRGQGGQDAYEREMSLLSERERATAVEYLENHDKPRVAAEIRHMGFGSPDANYLLAPLQFLYSSGPALILNGQEVGEPGAGQEGFHMDPGRTTFFDYWCMPEFAKWVNQHAYDGARLSSSRQALRQYFSQLFELCQHSCVRASGYWGLKYFNRSSRFADCPDDLYTFARFEPGSGRLLLLVANFRYGTACSGTVRIPEELAASVGFKADVAVKLVFDRSGSRHRHVATLTREKLAESGFTADPSEGETQVFELA